jgi:FtsH-binding integral membrane protein
MIDNKNVEYAIYNGNSVSRYLVSVFSKMGLGLFITFATSMIVGVLFPQIAIGILSSQILMIGIVIAELGIIFSISRQVAKLQSTRNINIMYYVFTLLNGLILSYIYFVFNSREILGALLATCIFFTTLASYGHYTKKNLSHWGSILHVAIISIAIVSIFNIIGSLFFGYNNVVLSLLISSATIIVTSLYVAYDIQTIRQMYFAVSGNKTSEEIVSTMGAFSMYLNFLTIFQHILRIIFLTRDNKR